MIDPRHLASCLAVTTCALAMAAWPTRPAVPSFEAAPERATTWMERLGGLEGVAHVERLGETDTHQIYALELTQPVDHDDPTSPTFTQRMYLYHRSAEAPMVLLTTGYGLGNEEAYRGFEPEAARLLDANRLVLGHRFFPGAEPDRDDTDWSALTIAQAAADNHRVVETLRPLYPAAWVGTGWSKGGMTVIFHERFYPDDLDLAMPMVAPISRQLADPRYPRFLAQIGTPECRARVMDTIDASLGRLDELAREAAGPDADAEDRRLTRLWVKDTLVWSPWVYWQHRGPAECGSIPDGRTADAEALLEFFFIPTSRAALAPYLPFGGPAPVYPFQAITQLGAPDYMPTGHLERLEGLGHLTADEVRSMRQEIRAAGSGNAHWNVLAPHDPAPMRDIDRWLREDAEGMIAIYGADDPWTAGRVHLNEARDSRVYVAPARTHATFARDLEPADYAEVRDRILELAPTAAPPDAYAPSAEARESLRRMLREGHL
jgi:hypothetical protein